MNTDNIKSNFQFIGNSITSLNIHNDFVALPESDVSKRVDVSYDIQNAGEDEDGIWGMVNLYVDCSLVAESEDETDKPKAYSVRLVLNGCFTDNKDVPFEEFEKMLKINGFAALYSVARSIIISISAQSVVSGSIVLPMINVFKLHKKDAGNKQKQLEI